MPSICIVFPETFGGLSSECLKRRPRTVGLFDLINDLSSAFGEELGFGYYEGRGWEAFIIMPPYASPPMAFSLRKEVAFSLCTPADLSYAPRNFRPSSNPAAPRARAERRNPYSIASMRIQLASQVSSPATASAVVENNHCGAPPAP
jgi:hypothetical protein